MSPTKLTIGVTGHRDPHPDDVAAAEAALDAVLADLQQRLPDTALQLACGLADGADRLAARVALRRRIPVIALLPQPLDEYCGDFTADSLAEFHTLLATPGVNQVSLPACPGESAGESLYHRLGEHLARKSNILVVLWDGARTGRAGGTAEVLLRFLHALPELETLDPEIELVDGSSDEARGPDFACWIPMRRQGNGNAVRPIAREKIVSGNLGPGRVQLHDRFPDELATILRELNAFNHQFRALAPSAGDCTVLSLPPGSSRRAGCSLVDFADEFSKADYLAVYNQRRSDRVFQLTGWLAVTMGLSFLVYAKLWPLPFLLYSYVMAFIAAVAITHVARRRHWFSRHLMYRVVAEAARTRFFLGLAGVAGRVDLPRLLDVTGISHFAGFSWIIHVLRAAEPWVDTTTVANNVSMEQLGNVRRDWIDDQAAYFKAKVARLTGRHQFFERLKTLLLAALLLVAISLLAFKDPLAQVIVLPTVSLKTFMIFLMGFLPLAFGVWEVYQHKMATRELLWQYRNQAEYFRVAAAKLRRVQNPESARSIIEQLGYTCLVDGFLWALHRYHREHEPAAAG